MEPGRCVPPVEALIKLQPQYYLLKEQFTRLYLSGHEDIECRSVKDALAKNLRRRLRVLRREAAAQFPVKGLSFLCKAEEAWLTRLGIELDTMSSEIDRPVLTTESNVKQAGSQLKMRRKELSFLYDSRDLYQTMKATLECEQGLSPVNWLPMILHTLCFNDLQEKLGSLKQSIRQIGLDDEPHGSTEAKSEFDSFQSKREAVVEKAILSSDYEVLERLTKLGCPASLRARTWKCLLLEEDDAVLSNQMQHLRLWSLGDSLVDSLHHLDLQYIEDNDEYFVFKDLLQQTLSTFSRDRWVVAQLGSRFRNVDLCVLPFKGLIMFAAPLVYLFHDEKELYLVFRKMYVRFWWKLNSFSSSDPESILSLCLQFQRLVQVRNPEVVFHLANLGIELTERVIEWIHLGFAKHLRVAQLLHLWDRIVGYDSLLPIPLLAAAIVSFKARSLLKATSKDEVEGILNERRNLNVVALLQGYLYQDTLDDNFLVSASQDDLGETQS